MMKRLISGVVFALSAAAMGGIAFPLVAQPLSADTRPMQVDAASEAIVRATVSGPRFYAPEIFAAIEDYHNPRLRRLREEYGLEKVVAGEPNEFRRLLKLRHWVHTRWPIDNDQKEGGDVSPSSRKPRPGLGSIARIP